MKGRIIIILLAICSIKVAGQHTVVTNVELMKQVTVNNVVRLSSIHSFEKLFKEQREIYEENEKQITKILAVHEYIYKQLSNVNSLFRQTKQVKYIKQYMERIVENGEEMIRLSTQNPEYSVWITKYYEELIKRTIRLKEQLATVLLKPDKNLLIDPYDRDKLIENIFYSLRKINHTILGINNLINFGKSYAYIYSIPVLGNYVSQDKMIAEGILKKIKRFNNY
ncbi:hypothetical protein CAPN002_25870 [Capnocytophaga stomatis]|uniref:hypothetical protein n=1 Tax=Capnocytophaga stomatis TaxID=1848904 RepID=UPI001950CFBB|nr:hypothetical protein [Capnocytophaga stomatis]GIJ95369.1 hypothetical protein CAPN002_25870 [Capnocytophaga stomatis]